MANVRRRAARVEKTKRALHARRPHFELGLATAGAAHQTGVDPYFERKFISFETGFVKPNPLAFQHALETMELHPSEAIHVGDDPNEDIKGAELSGIRAYLIDRKTRPINSRMITTLDEIFLRI